jgi:CHRD domain-containing protein
MRSLRAVVGRRSVWMYAGAALLVAGCSEMVVPPQQVPLTGAQEVPAVTTSAGGLSDITVGLAKCPYGASGGTCPTMWGTVRTSGIKGTAAHIHQGAPGQNGPVIVPLVKISDNVWMPLGGSATLTDAQYAAYWAGNTYVNVHSEAHPNGEIRAQLKPR